MTDHATLRARRRLKAHRIWDAVQAGSTLRDAAKAQGFGAKRAGQLLHEFFQVDLRRRPALLPRAANPPLPIPTERPWWSHPDEQELLYAQQVREEIAEAEGFERPIP